MFSREQGLSWVKEQACFQGRKSFFFLRTWLFHGINKFSCSLGSLNSFFGDMIPRGKGNFLYEQWIALEERFKFYEETYILNFLAITVIS
jgi:hypothetical protein